MSSVELFAISLALALVYGWIGYPLLVLTWSRLVPRVRPRSLTSEPTCAVVIAAHNEAPIIGARVANVLAQRLLPGDEIIVASDGSTDETCANAMAAGGGRVRVLDLVEHLGRAHAHNVSAETSPCDVLVFTDAATRFEPGFLDAIRRSFQDPSVGGAVAKLRYEAPISTPISLGEQLYWRYELWLREAESHLGVLGNGTGAAMALRRSLYRHLRLNEDVDTASPIDIVLQDARFVYVPDAVAIDNPPETERGEINAKVRGVAQTVVCITNRLSWRACLTHPRFLWSLLSHRVIRYLTLPLLVMSSLAAGAAVALGTGPVVTALAAAFAVMFVGAALGWLVRRWWAAAGLPAAFLIATYGMTLGVVAALRGRAPATYRSVP